MSLLLVADTFHPAFSGAAIRFRRYLPGLRLRGVTVRILCGTPTVIKAEMMGVKPAWLEYPIGQFLPVERLGGALLHRVRLPDTNSQKRRYALFRSLIDLYRKQAHEIDLVQCLAVGVASVPGMLRLRSLGIPILTEGTMSAEPPSGFLTGALKRRLRRTPWNLSDCVVAHTEAMRKYLREIGVRSRIEVIGNGVDLTRFAPCRDGSRGRLRRALGIGENDPVLLYVGLVNRRKGADLLLEAWMRMARRLPRAHLLVLGPRRDTVDPAYRSFHRKIEKLIDASGARHRIHFLGTVPNVEEHMRAADVLVFPSRREGLPNVVLEAMASGLPVVLTPYVGRRSEIGRAGREYVLARFDPDSLAVAVLEVLGDPDRRAQLGEAGRAWVERHADLEDSLDAYVRLYGDLCAARAKGRVEGAE